MFLNENFIPPAWMFIVCELDPKKYFLDEVKL